jgi:hypothetical protein
MGPQLGPEQLLPPNRDESTRSPALSFGANLPLASTRRRWETLFPPPPAASRGDVGRAAAVIAPRRCRNHSTVTLLAKLRG